MAASISLDAAAFLDSLLIYTVSQLNFQVT